MTESEDYMDRDTTIKIFGFRWNTETDTIWFQNSIEIKKKKSVNKR